MNRLYAAVIGMAELPLAPLWALQGLRVARRTPRLEPASGAAQGLSGRKGRRRLRLLVIGESTVAGVGAASHASALTGQIAEQLAEACHCAVQWTAAGRIGATARAATDLLLPTLRCERADIVVVALGVNDVLSLRSPQRWRDDLQRLIEALRERLGPVPVVLAAVPPIASFPTLAEPLRSVLGRRAWRLDMAAQALAATMPAVLHDGAQLDARADGVFCSDRFHPSERGYALWGRQLATAAVRALAANAQR